MRTPIFHTFVFMKFLDLSGAKNDAELNLIER